MGLDTKGFEEERKAEYNFDGMAPQCKPDHHPFK